MRDLSLSLDRGEGIMIQGRSGCGKTTLLNLIAFLDSPNRGSVFFQGKSLESMKDAEKSSLRNRRIGYCLQTPHFLSHFTVLENLIVPLLLSGDNIGISSQKAMQMLQQLGLKGLQHLFPASLSGGQLQRLSLGRALIGNPLLLLVDEPTGNLDETTAAEILDLIMNYHRKNNTALVLVTHDPIDATNDMKRYVLSDARLTAMKNEK